MCGELAGYSESPVNWGAPPPLSTDNLCHAAGLEIALGQPLYRFVNELSWLNKEIVEVCDINKFALLFLVDLNFPLIFFEYGFEFWLNIFRVRYNYGAYSSWWSINLLMIEIVAYTINLSTVAEFKLCLTSREATIKIRSNSTYSDVLGLKLNLVR